MRKKITKVLCIVLLICSMTACNNTNEIKQNTENIEDTIINSSSTDAMTDEEREAVEQLLEDKGIDKSILDERTNTDGGGTILGKAKPVKQFQTLHDGEQYYESYFGFHNSIESLPGYELVGLYCINDEFMEGIYESAETESTLTVKFSKTLKSKELREPYSELEYVTHINITDDIGAHIEGENSESINLILIDYQNSKSYSIYTKQSLTAEIAQNIANELTNNVMSMSDWNIN